MRYYIDNCVISMVYEEHPGSERYDIYYYEGSPTGVNKELDEYEQYLALKKGCDSDTVISPKKSIQTEEEIEQEPFDEEENSRHKRPSTSQLMSHLIKPTILNSRDPRL